MVRPGGSVADLRRRLRSLTFGSSDARLGQAMERAVQSMIMSSPRVMRELPRLLPKAGLRLIATQAHVYAEAGIEHASCSTSPRPTGRWSASTGLLPAADVDAWLADQRRSAGDGTFFAACNYYAYVGERRCAMTWMHRIITGWAAVLALAAALPSAASRAAARPSGEVIREWNETARSQPFGNSLRLARILAIMHAAQHDASTAP